MKLFLSSLVLSAVLGCLTGCSPRVEPPLPPGLIVEAPQATVPPVFAGEPIHHDFKLTNVSQDTITIQRADPGCFGVFTLGLQRIAPGRSIVVGLDVETKLLGVGEINYSARLLTSDKGAPEIALKIITRVLPEFTLSQTVIDLGSRRSADTNPVLVMLQVTGPPRSKPLSARSTNPAIDVTLSPRSRSTYVIAVSQRPGAPAGSHSGNIVIVTSSAFSPELRIPVRGSVLSF